MATFNAKVLNVVGHAVSFFDAEFQRIMIYVKISLICTERKVIYKDEITSLSAIVGQIKGVKHIQGSLYFTYNGRSLIDIANETQWKDC